MKFTCKVPVLQNSKAFPFLHVEASGSTATFTAFTGKSEVHADYSYTSRIHDHYVYVQVTVPAVVEEAGGASFESKTWKLFSKNEVAVSTDTPMPTTASVSFGVAAQQLVQIIEPIKMPPECSKPLFPLTLDLGVADAVSKDETRPHLNCLHLQAKGGFVQTTATDGHRMHRTSAPFKGSDFEMTVPRSAVEALRSTRRSEAMCAPGLIRIGATTVHFPHWLVAFPPCDRIIPQGADRTTQLPVKELLRLLKAYPKAQEIPDDKDVGSITLDVSSEGIKISRSGYYERSIAAKTNTLQPGEVFKIGMNQRYIIEALALVGEGATMASYGDLDPMLFRAGDRLAVVMPSRI